jgi:hypothetical protein
MYHSEHDADAGEGGEACWAISLEAWAALDTGRRARLLADTAPDLAALRRQLAALLAGAPDACGRRQRADLLARLLAHYAPGRLAWCAQLVEAEAQRLQVCSTRMMPFPSCLYSAVM